MATQYYPITAQEMADFLKPDKGWVSEIHGGELVFSKKIAIPNIQVKVYSGIKSNTGESRGCGKDAIRVAAVDVVNHRGWIKSKRVHRVVNWKANLKGRVLKVIEQSHARMR